MDRDNAARKKAVATMIKRAQLRQKLADPVENKKAVIVHTAVGLLAVLIGSGIFSLILNAR